MGRWKKFRGPISLSSTLGALKSGETGFEPDLSRVNMRRVDDDGVVHRLCRGIS